MSLRDHAGINAGDPTRPQLLEGLTGPPPWTIDALCVEVDPELFFPEKGSSNKPAKAVCGRCEVQQECLNYALDYESGETGGLRSHPAGIYGGLSVKERRRLIRAREAGDAA